MNKYRIVISRWKSIIIKADGFNEYFDDRVIVFYEYVPREHYNDAKSVAVFNLDKILGVYKDNDNE